jgi:hypothetical protein
MFELNTKILDEQQTDYNYKLKYGGSGLIANNI